MSAKNNSAAEAAGLSLTVAARTRLAAIAAVSVAGTGALALAFLAFAPTAASASTHPAGVPASCAAAPSKCGYPDATNTGVPAGTALLNVPGQVSSGPGWTFETTSGGFVQVTGNGAVLSGLNIPYNVNIKASDVTLKDDKIVVGGGTSSYAVSLRTTVGVTIEDSTISGQNATTGRAAYGIDDIYADSTGLTIENNNITDARTGVELAGGQVTGNYIHDFGYVSGDHTNGIFVAGSTMPLVINDNTILNNFSQTDAISLDASASGQPVANKTIENNLLAGGSYTIYGGDSLGNITSDIVVDNNRFGQTYYSTGGQYGPVAYFASAGIGNVWADNYWDTTGQTVPSP
jgi:hypothetical protein